MQPFFCHQCGYQNAPNATQCLRCGTARAIQNPSGHAPSPPHPYAPPQPHPHAPPQPYPHAPPQPYPHAQPQPHAQQQLHPPSQQQLQRPGQTLLHAYPPGQQPYREPPATAPAQPRPNFDHLGYGGKLIIPEMCTCCAGPAQTTASTDQVMTGSRSYAWFRFPYCKRCKWHMTWSGRFRTGMVSAFGWMFAGGGVVGGVALGLGGEGADRQSNAIVYAILGAITGYLVCMLLVMLLGLAVAPRRPECTCRGAAVRIRRGYGVWHFRFTNPRFEDAFRALNRGFEPIVPAALRRR